MSRNIVVRAVIIRNGELFVVRNKDKQGNPQKWLNLVGGKVEDGEGIVDAMIREVIEETGITPIIGNLLFIQQFGRSGNEPKEFVEFFFDIKNVEDFAEINLASTTHGLEELSEAKFVNPKNNAEILPKFLSSIDFDGLSSNNVQFFNYL